MRFLPYRPLPFLGVVAGQMGQISRVRSLANPLTRGGFASVMGKIGSPKNKLPLPAPSNLSFNHLTMSGKMHPPNAWRLADHCLLFRMQDEFLYPPVQEFTHEQRIFRGAGNLVHPSELSDLLSPFPKCAEDVAVKVHLEDASGIRV